jgi:hypothetical protein
LVFYTGRDKQAKTNFALSLNLLSINQGFSLAAAAGAAQTGAKISPEFGFIDGANLIARTLLR